MRIHTIDDLADDLRAVPVTFARKAPAVVRRNVKDGERVAVRLARAGAGPHGKNYYKRISHEMRGPLTGEYGPEGNPKTEFVGVGWRRGVNMDLPNSADVIGPKFADEVGSLADSLFWP